MAAADDLTTAYDALASLIKAKLSGATDLSAFYNRQLGSVRVNASTSLKELFDALAQLGELISKASGGTWETTINV